MKPLRLFTALITCGLGLYTTLAFTYNSSPPTSETGAPGEQNCSRCHGSSASKNPAKFQISAAGGITNFTPGQKVNLTVTILKTATVKNGFEASVRNGSNLPYGTISVTDPTNTNLTSIGGKQFVRHTNAGNQHNTWNFAWTAPAAKDTLSAYFYACGVESNNNGRDGSGDNVYLATFKLPALRAVTAINAKLIETESVRLFPNPCTEAVHIGLTLAQSAPVIARLINTAGVAKEERTFFVEAGSNTLRWDFATKPLPGMYVLSLTAGGYTTAQKILVQ